MRSFTKLLFAALLAVLVMSTAAGIASANRSLSLNNGGTRAFSYSGRITFAEPGGGFIVACDVLRSLTITRSAIPKVEGTAFALVSMRNSNCSGGNVSILNPPSWSVRYVSFTGTLPSITSLTLEIAPTTLGAGGFLLSVFFYLARCLYGGNIRYIATVNGTGELSQIRAEEHLNSPTTDLGGLTECPEGIFRGIMVPLAGTPAIRIRLV